MLLANTFYLLLYSNAFQHILSSFYLFPPRYGSRNSSPSSMSAQKNQTTSQRCPLFHKTWMVIYLSAFFTVHQPAQAHETQSTECVDIEYQRHCLLPITIRTIQSDEFRRTERVMGQKCCLINVSISDWSSPFLCFVYRLLIKRTRDASAV